MSFAKGLAGIARGYMNAENQRMTEDRKRKQFESDRAYNEEKYQGRLADQRRYNEEKQKEDRTYREGQQQSQRKYQEGKTKSSREYEQEKFERKVLIDVATKLPQVYKDAFNQTGSYEAAQKEVDNVVAMYKKNGVNVPESDFSQFQSDGKVYMNTPKGRLSFIPKEVIEKGMNEDIDKLFTKEVASTVEGAMSSVMGIDPSTSKATGSMLSNVDRPQTKLDGYQKTLKYEGSGTEGMPKSTREKINDVKLQIEELRLSKAKGELSQVVENRMIEISKRLNVLYKRMIDLKEGSPGNIKIQEEIEGLKAELENISAGSSEKTPVVGTLAGGVKNFL